MASPSTDWIGNHRRPGIALFVLLLAVIAGEGYLLFQQSLVIRASRAQSDRLRTKFLGADTAQFTGAPGVRIRLQNVRFKWSDRVYIDAGNMALRAVPVQGTSVNFDDPESYHLVVQKSVVLIRPDVLAGMFNESIFNYPGSRVKKLQVSIVTDDKGRRQVKLSGKVNLVVWIPFSMYAHLSVDTLTNVLVIAVDHLRVFGGIHATSLIRWAPLHLDRVIALPPNRSLLVDGNRIMVRPFGLFPPPRVDGTMTGVEVGANAISIAFSGDAIPAPESPARNYVYMRGGTSQVGRFRMTDTDVLILDQDQANPFVFSLLHYAEMLPRSKVEIPDIKSARITMPDS
ncbi:MAG: hypothetical protein HZB25_05005 [Candidatus Eisenbacteria bacterium]|nr:hypothetical protein [Candidatus Eisenbacteria bacterium]